MPLTQKGYTNNTQFLNQFYNKTNKELFGIYVINKIRFNQLFCGF